LVPVLMRYTGTQGILQDITATLNGTAMTRLAQANPAAGNFQIVWLWASSADVPSGTWNVVISNGTANFNGVTVGVYEVANAADTQTGAVGSNQWSAGATSRTPSVTTTAVDSKVMYGAVHGLVGTGITGADTTLIDGTTNAGNTVTWCALAFEDAPTTGTYDATFNATSSTNFLAAGIEIVS
jgi:hypothetical protein